MLGIGLEVGCGCGCFCDCGEEEQSASWDLMRLDEDCTDGVTCRILSLEEDDFSLEFSDGEFPEV